MQTNFDDEFDNVDRALNEALEKFQGAGRSYDEAGARSEKIIITHLDHLRDPKTNRAVQVQQGAAAAIAEIRKFASTNAELTSQIAMLLLALQQNILTAETRMIGIPAFKLSSNSAASTVEAVNKYVKKLDARNLENAAVVATAILLGRRVADAVQAATQPITMRQRTLEQAACELAPEQVVAPGKVGQVAKTTKGAFADELKMLAFEEILKEAALELGTRIPIAGIIVSIARVVKDTRARQAALNERYVLQLGIRDAAYRHGPIDVMFDLPAQLQDEDRITAGVIALISQLIDALRK